FSTAIAHRIITPRTETVLMCIERPGISRASLRNNRTKLWICNNVDPWCRRSYRLVGKNLIFLTIWRKATCSIEKQQVTWHLSRPDIMRLSLCYRLRRQERRQCLFDIMTIYLFQQRTIIVLDNHTGNTFKQY